MVCVPLGKLVETMKSREEQVEVLKARYNSLCDDLVMAFECRQSKWAVADIQRALLRIQDEINTLEYKVDTDVET